MTEIVSFTASGDNYLPEAGPVTLASDGSLYVVVNERSASLGVEFYTVGFYIYHYAADGTSSVVAEFASQSITSPLYAGRDGNLSGALALAEPTTNTTFAAVLQVTPTTAKIIGKTPLGPDYEFVVPLAPGIDTRLHVVSPNAIYSLRTDGSDLQLLKTFPQAGPSSGLTLASKGYLYGGLAVAQVNGPSVYDESGFYSISPEGVYTGLLSFQHLGHCSEPNCAVLNQSLPGSPSGLFAEGSDGLLYGTVSGTQAADATHLGFVYSLNLGLNPPQ